MKQGFKILLISMVLSGCASVQPIPGPLANPVVAFDLDSALTQGCEVRRNLVRLDVSKPITLEDLLRAAVKDRQLALKCEEKYDSLLKVIKDRLKKDL